MRPGRRGVDVSLDPAGGYDKKAQAGDMRSVLTQLGLSCAAVAGHDIGTMVAYAYAARYPARPKSCSWIHQRRGSRSGPCSGTSISAARTAERGGGARAFTTTGLQRIRWRSHEPLRPVAVVGSVGGESIFQIPALSKEAARKEATGTRLKKTNSNEILRIKRIRPRSNGNVDQFPGTEYSDWQVVPALAITVFLIVNFLLGNTGL